MVKLYDYQEKLVKNARQAFKEGHKGVVIISPAGSGKSVIIAKIAKLTTDNGGQVLFMVHRQELVNQITESFKQAKVDMNRATIMTVGKIKNRLGKLPNPSLIITDETHHSLAKTFRTIYDYYSDVPRLGFTATLWRMNGQGFQDVYSKIIEGPTVQWLIDHKRLAPYSYYSVNLIDTHALKKANTGDYTAESMNEAFGKTIYGDAVKVYKDKVFGQKAILYAYNVKSSKTVASAFNQAGIPAAHADSKTNKEERERIMNDFKNGRIKVLCGVDLYGEGINITDCSVAIMLRPTASLSLDIQQMMRCMRYVPGKKATIIDHVGNYLKHGLPTDIHEWKLDGSEHSGRTSNSSNVPGITTCEQCFAVFERKSLTNCPYCGAELAKPKELEVVDDVKLEKINLTETLVERAKKVMNSNVAGKRPQDLNSYAEVKEYQELMGYKQGWTYFYAKKRGFIK